jgi:hypothetical protein
LNEPAGKIASQVLKWVVPQIVACWDDERADVDRTLNRIIEGTFHHPAQRSMGQDGAVDGRQQMFRVVEDWWREQSSREQQGLRRQLSREGVQRGENHKPGVHDKGHGCGKPLGMAKTQFGGGGSNVGAQALMSGFNSALGGSSSSRPSGVEAQIGKFASEAAGGGALGGLLGAVAGGVGGSLLSGAFGGGEEEKKAKKSSYNQEGYTHDGGYQQSHTEYGQSGNKYAQAQYTETHHPGGGHQAEYNRYEQSSHGTTYSQHTEVKKSSHGGYERTTEHKYGRDNSRERKDRRDSDEKREKKEKKYKSKSKYFRFEKPPY